MNDLIKTEFYLFKSSSSDVSSRIEIGVSPLKIGRNRLN